MFVSVIFFPAHLRTPLIYYVTFLRGPDLCTSLSALLSIKQLKKLNLNQHTNISLFTAKQCNIYW